MSIIGSEQALEQEEQERSETRGVVALQQRDLHPPPIYPYLNNSRVVVPSYTYIYTHA